MKKPRKLKPLQLNGHTKEIARDAQELELAQKVWEKRREGLSPFETAVALNIPTWQAKKLITASMDDYRSYIQTAVAEEMSLDIARLDMLLKRYIPVALNSTVDVTRFDSRAEAFTDKEWKYCLEAGKLCKEIVSERAKILGYSKTENNPVVNNHAYFMAGSELDFINKIVSEQEPKAIPDVTDLEFE